MTRLPYFCFCLLLACSGFGELHAQESIDFSRDILPIFADNCFACHGPDAAKREGGFRLDERASAFGEADSGERPIVPGNVDASELLRRLRSTDDSEVMPPPEEKKRPTSEQLELLESWIRNGAEWKEHWAFIPPRRPELPAVKNESWVRNPIDNFVLAKLESLGHQPSTAANKTTLVRRVCLDLIGLPPTPEQVERFLADDSPDAYEKLVDRLLDSPSYGEHMATFWLDAARFADTNGYQNDFRRSMWLWRDWVIIAYNDNMPFDQFAIEQLAGDMLPDATQNQKIASGFNRNHRSNTEGGSINEEWLVENVVDRVETTSTVFLGLTMGCARCHDHKYDPISQREFYQFFSYFNNVDEQGVYTEKRGNAGPTVSVVTVEHEEKAKIANANVVEHQEMVDLINRAIRVLQPRWESELLEVTTKDVPGHRLSLFSRVAFTSPKSIVDLVDDARNTHVCAQESIGPTIEISSEDKAPMDERHLVLGSAFEFDAAKGFSVAAWVRPTSFGAIISRMDESNAYRGFDMLIMPDGRMNVHLIHNWPDNATKITTAPSIPKDVWTHVAVTCSSPGKASDIKVFFNGQLVTQTVDSDTLNGTTLTDHPVWLGLRAKTPPFAGRISDIRAWRKALNDDSVLQLFTQTLEHLVVSTKLKRSEEEQADIDHLYRSSSSRNQDALQQLTKAERELEEVKKQLPTTMVMKELPEPRQTYVLKRGVYDQPDTSKPVSAGVPSLFNSDSKPANRLELAQWLVDGDNPLTARVAINHFWARYFGTGLLETAENFGVQSPPPSHPELLDWLATEFVRTGWDVKQMQRLIVTSATYRQSSFASPESFTTDPKNRLLGRGPRFRLPAETIRDNALAISGLLSDRIGGPSVKPYQPEGLWEELAGGAGEPPYKQATNDDLYRRSLYIYRKRTVPHPAMTTFDGVGRDVCTVARDRTNTPLQALALLNDTTYVEAARNLASLAIDHDQDHVARLVFAFQRATGRQPDDTETAVLESGFEKYRKRFAANPDAAKEYIAVGQSKPDANHDPVELAAYATVCSVILNLDEVITKE